jgi:hypothetical protein
LREGWALSTLRRFVMARAESARQPESICLCLFDSGNPKATWPSTQDPAREIQKCVDGIVSAEGFQSGLPRRCAPRSDGRGAVRQVGSLRWLTKKDEG